MFEAKDGEAKDGEGAYQYNDSASGAIVFAYVDFYKSNKVYCIQAFSASEKDKILDPTKCSYSNSKVIDEMKTQTTEFLIAYRIACGISTTKYPLKSVPGLVTAAQKYLDGCPKGSDKAPMQQTNTALKNEILAQNGKDAPKHFAQITMSMSSDSIGFANSVLETEKTSDYITYTLYSYVPETGGGKKVYYHFQYLGVAASADGNGHTYMVIDLVDYWEKTDDPTYDPDYQ